MWQLLFKVGIELVSWVLDRNRQSKEMHELYMKFIEKQQDRYMNSAAMRESAKERLKLISEKPFQESP